VDKFRHARFEPAGMTSNRDIPFAKSLIDYIFCWLGCQFIRGYAETNTPNRAGATAGNKNVTTAREVVEKTRDLAQKIAQARNKPEIVDEEDENGIPIKEIKTPLRLKDRFSSLAEGRVKELVPAGVDEQDEDGQLAEARVISAQFEHFQDDAPACDICGAITVRNGTCYKCFNCGNSMGCS